MKRQEFLLIGNSCSDVKSHVVSANVVLLRQSRYGRQYNNYYVGLVVSLNVNPA